MKKALTWLLLLLNTTSAAFTIIYSITFSASKTANVFGVIMIGTLFFNVLYAVCCISKRSFYYLWGFLLALCVSLATGYVSVLPAFQSSVSYGSIAALMFIYLGGALLCASTLYRPLTKDVHHSKFFLTSIVDSGLLAAAVLIALCFVCYDALFSTNRFELFIGGLFFYLAFFTWGLMGLICFSLLATKPARTFRIAGVIVCVIIGGTALTGFISPMSTLHANIRQGDGAYMDAFGRTFLEKTEGFRSVHFSVPEFFLGIRTTGYTSDMDVQYYKSDSGVDAGLKLAYDVYYPDHDTGKKRPVLIRLHGSGGDKGSGNYPSPNKYFASKGYVVYDLQYGDYQEKQEPNYFNPGFSSEQTLSFLRHFVTYAKANNSQQADWNSVFVSGNSMGGGLADFFALQFGQGNPDYEALGITIKGIIPIYPTSGGVSPDLINPNSPPCLMYMGTHDGYVNTEFAYELPEMYRGAGNQRCAAFIPQYAGHGSDGYFYGHYMQNFIYYMERFMAQYQ